MFLFFGFRVLSFSFPFLLFSDAFLSFLLPLFFVLFFDLDLVQVVEGRKKRRRECKKQTVGRVWDSKNETGTETGMVWNQLRLENEEGERAQEASENKKKGKERKNER